MASWDWGGEQWSSFLLLPLFFEFRFLLFDWLPPPEGYRTQYTQLFKERERDGFIPFPKGVSVNLSLLIPLNALRAVTLPMHPDFHLNFINSLCDMPAFLYIWFFIYAFIFFGLYFWCACNAISRVTWGPEMMLPIWMLGDFYVWKKAFKV